jgi:hypothetical protein
MDGISEVRIDGNCEESMGRKIISNDGRGNKK